MPEFESEISTEYISACCNPNPGCFDVNKDDLICYGSGCSVILCRLKEPAKVLKSYVGHTGRVNCVKWLNSKHGFGRCFVSGSYDEKAIIWMEVGNEFKQVAEVKGHKGSITCIDCIEVSSSSILLVTSSTDCSTKVWNITRNEDRHCVELLDTLELNNKLVLSLASTLFSECPVPLIACGAEDQRIHLFVANGNQEFKNVISLPGHLQWIKSLSFTHDGLGILLASASQDHYVRIWRISLNDDGACEDDLKLTSDLFTCNEFVFKVGLEAILQSHEGWVSSAHWNKKHISDDNDPLRLLTSSMDKIIIEWEIDEASGVWLEKVRVGEAGGSNLGFIGAKFSSSGDDILACSFHGAFHLWSRDKDNNLMKPGVTCSGHLGNILDLSWNKTGEFLLSVGSDQTTRIHAQWRDDKNYDQWYEIARPQIHGYDMRCISSIDRLSFASGADEKIIRVFKASKNFVTNCINLCHSEFSEQEVDSFGCEGACVPALGLSNKSVESAGDEVESGNYFVPQYFQEPPTEENLLQNTLWPEEHKLYGHGYEVFALACNSSGTVVASTCKASQKEHAVIILWEVGSWKQIKKLYYHTLTVTQLKFSHDDQYLLSVSRDRTWSVYKRTEEDSYCLFSSIDKRTKLCTRIIWGCSWSHDDKYFVTVSRDKKAIVWCLNDSIESSDEDLKHRPTSEVLETIESITAVDFAPCLVSERYLLALGMDNGIIQLYSWMPTDDGASWNCLITLDHCSAHHKMVQKMSFRPLGNSSKDDEHLRLATCSEDGSLKIFKINKH